MRLSIVMLTLLLIISPALAGGMASNGQGLCAVLHPPELLAPELGNATLGVDLNWTRRDPQNLSLEVMWSRVMYEAQALGAGGVVQAQLPSEEGRGDNATHLLDFGEQLDQKYGLAWSSPGMEGWFDNVSGLHRFGYLVPPAKEPQAGYYLFKVTVYEHDKLVALCYSESPLALKVEGAPISLTVQTMPNYGTSTLYYRVSYSGPFLENPVIFLSAQTELGVLENYRINITGSLDPQGGVLDGNYSFAPYPIPAGTYSVVLRAIDGSGKGIVLATNFSLGDHSFSKEQPQTLKTPSGRTAIELEVKEDVVNGRISMEELEMNPFIQPDAGVIRAKYGAQVSPGKMFDIGRYISVAPSGELEQQLSNATLRFWVNGTDLDANGEKLGERLPGLRAFRYDEVLGEWEYVASEWHDAGYVSAQVDHFSVYGVFGTNIAPAANAGNDRQVVAGETVVFYASASDIDGNVVRYEWDFNGDGSWDWSSDEPDEAVWDEANQAWIVKHTYAVDGNYNAQLRVTDDEESTAFDSTEIAVGETGDRSAWLPALPLWLVVLALLGAALRRRRRD